MEEIDVLSRSPPLVEPYSTSPSQLLNSTGSTTLQATIPNSTIIATTLSPIVTTTNGNNVTIASSHTYSSSTSFIETQKLYMIVYSIFILASIVFTSVRSIIFYKISMNASKGLHNKMFSCILKAPMGFFDKNPSGEKFFKK